MEIVKSIIQKHKKIFIENLKNDLEGLELDFPIEIRILIGERDENHL